MVARANESFACRGISHRRGMRMQRNSCALQAREYSKPHVPMVKIKCRIPNGGNTDNEVPTAHSSKEFTFPSVK